MKSRGEMFFFCDEDIVSLAVLIVRELSCYSRRLGLRVFDALFHILKRDL